MKPPRLQRTLLKDSDVSRPVGPSDYSTLVDTAMGGWVGQRSSGKLDDAKIPTISVTFQATTLYNGEY